MRSTHRAAVLAVLLLASAPASAEIGTAIIFPSCASTPGQYGAYFRTRLSIYNPNSSPVVFFLGLLTPDGSYPPGGRFITVDSMSFYWHDDILADVLGYTGGASLVVMDKAMRNNFFAWAEVYTEGPAGRYSTPVTGLVQKDRVPRQFETGYAFVGSLQVDSDNRANFGCGNIDDVATTVTATISGWDGTAWSTSTVDVDVPAEGWKQLAVPVQGQMVSIRFNIKLGGGSLGTYCYGVKVNNTSNDGTAIPALRFPPQ